MKRTFVPLLATTLLIAPSFLHAKGNTIRIIITGGDLAAPIEISDLAITTQFHVWAGPGTGRMVGGKTLVSQDEPGLIIDWPGGIVEPPPKGLQIYNVSLVTTRTNPSTYTVRYAIDPATKNGYVYVPGKADPEYRDNTWLIYRGNEGNWFNAWSEWEKVARPLIAKNSRSR